jgi:hypothetical protein
LGKDKARIGGQSAALAAAQSSSFFQQKPVEATWCQSQLVGSLTDSRKLSLSHHLYWYQVSVLIQVEFNWLRGLRQVKDAKHSFIQVGAGESKYPSILGFNKIDRSAPKDRVTLS